MSPFDYSSCLFQARLQKSSLLRRSQQFYLYFSPTHLIINHQAYSKTPDIILQLLPTTHIKWLWQQKKQMKLKGFIIQTEGYLNQFTAERVVLKVLKERFMEIVLQSDFFDQYTLGKYLDKGNYAQVYQCARRDNHQRHAVKILEKQRLKTIKNGKESVFNELKILRNLHHKNLMTLFEVFEDRNKYYFVLELLEGITLYKQIQNRKKKRQFKPHQIRGTIKQILQGVSYLNKQNIMHRDIKPQNILFTSKQCLQQNEASQGLKIVDYGLATFQHEEHVIFTKCGTPGFVAPEIITYDEKEPIYKVNVDVFSVGVILHILLVGEQPFPGRSRNTILNKNKECKFDFKSKKYQAIATDGIDLLAKLLQKNIEKRITPSQALCHPFLLKDRPIFKFKKLLCDQKQNLYQNLQMKMYKNLQQIANQQVTPHQDPQSARSKLASKYMQQLIHYDPFSYDQLIRQQNGQEIMINSVRIKEKRKVKFSIRQGIKDNSDNTSNNGNNQLKSGTINRTNRIRKASDGTEYLMPSVEAYQDASNFFSYERSKPS